MARDELITMLVGAGAGYLLGSAGKATGTPPAPTECLSIPLTTAQTIPEVTQEDYTRILDWGADTINNYWCPNIFTNGTDVFGLVSSYTIQNNIHRLTLKNLTQGTLLEYIGVNPSLVFDGDNAVVSSSLGTIIYNMVTQIASWNITTPEFTIVMTQQGKPFKYNDGEYMVLLPGSRYGQGFEIIGRSQGTLNGTAIQGLGVLERSNWNFSQLQINGYRYLVFFTTRAQGILVRVGPYQDAGVWLDRVYYKPLHSEINSISYDLNGIKTARILYLLDESKLLIIDLTRIGDMSINELQFNARFSLDRVDIGNGYAWLETSRI